MSEEIWKPVVGFHDYEVSNLGRVKSLGMFKNGRSYPPKILRPDRMKKGYLRACLAGRVRVLVHRLVANAFLDPIDGKNHVNHINGDKGDNRVANLEFVTISENAKHAADVLKINVGTKNRNAKLTDEAVREIRHSPFGPRKLSREHNVSHNQISMIKRGMAWKHIETTNGDGGGYSSPTSQTQQLKNQNVNQDARSQDSICIDAVGHDTTMRQTESRETLERR